MYDVMGTMRYWGTAEVTLNTSMLLGEYQVSQ